MIGYLEGVIRHGTVVTSSGVGYQVATAGAYAEGDTVELYVHTQVRESAITLFGFDSAGERELFEALIKVQGVGGNIALALLRDVGAAEVVAAVRADDPSSLKRAAGVGAALAKKVVGLVKLPASADDLAAGATVSRGPAAEVREALLSLGYPPAQATKLADEVAAEDLDASIEQLLSSALARA